MTTTNFRIDLSHRINHPKDDRRAYAFSITESRDPITGWRKNGPTENDVAYYNGVFASFQEAIDAITAYVSVPAFTIIREDRRGDYPIHYLGSAGARSRTVKSADPLLDGTAYTVLARVP